MAREPLQPDLTAWADSGGMALTGWPGQDPLPPPGPVLERAAAAAADFTRWAARWGTPPSVDVPALLFGRAALLGLERRGRISANGTCRLLRAADAWFAVNLARADDLEAVPAVVGRTLAATEDPWAALGDVATRTTADTIVDDAQLVGIPAAVLASVGPAADPVSWTPVGGPAVTRPPRIIDLSAMWAGPLCGRLLRSAGAEVVKVESPGRPDGARAGHPGFWNWLHGGQEILIVDLETRAGVAHLEELIAGADAVIDSSRPRALAQLGIRAEERAGPRLTWISITGYGRAGPWAGRVAFGDDAAVAGGLVARDSHGEPVFCGDALADPLSGIVAAAAGARAVATGGGLVSVAMAEVAAWAAAP